MYIDRWVDKEDVVHVYNEILLSHKKDDTRKDDANNAICSNMDGPGDYHTKWNKLDKERKISYDIAYMEI